MPYTLHPTLPHEPPQSSTPHSPSTSSTPHSSSWTPTHHLHPTHSIDIQSPPRVIVRSLDPTNSRTPTHRLKCYIQPRHPQIPTQTPLRPVDPLNLTYPAIVVIRQLYGSPITSGGTRVYLHCTCIPRSKNDIYINDKLTPCNIVDFRALNL